VIGNARVRARIAAAIDLLREQTGGTVAGD
jgi:hypothetical protein